MKDILHGTISHNLDNEAVKNLSKMFATHQYIIRIQDLKPEEFSVDEIKAWTYDVLEKEGNLPN